jgi:hypothetical protein
MRKFIDLQLAAKATWLAASAGRRYLAKDIANLLFCWLRVRWLIIDRIRRLLMDLGSRGRAAGGVADKSFVSRRKSQERVLL